MIIPIATASNIMDACFVSEFRLRGRCRSQISRSNQKKIDGAGRVKKRPQKSAKT
jgi:hypothetical protein